MKHKIIACRVSTRTSGKRSLRRSLAATSLLAVAPFLAYGRQSYAACVPSTSTIFICSDTSAGEDFTVDNGDFRTAANPPFEVTTNGVALDGLGHIRFTDNNASSITNTGGGGLDVRSNGDDGGIPGAVTIITNGEITGSTDGVYTLNQGTGSIRITLDGTVTGQAADGVEAINSVNGANFEVAVGAPGSVTGSSDGLDLENEGNGHLKVTVNGDVTGENGTGIEADNSGTYLAITTGANSIVKGFEYGIEADNDGSGDLAITIRGQVIGESYDGILAANEGRGLILTAQAGSHIQGFNDGIDAENEGTGDLTITTHGTVVGETLDGIVADNYETGGNLTITVGADSEVTGADDGIQTSNIGHGNLTITVNGTVTGTDAFGIQARNTYGEEYNPYSQETYHFYGVDLTITTGGASSVYGKNTGIFAVNNGAGNLAVTINGEVTGAEYDGLYALNAGTNLFVTTGANSRTVGQRYGIYAKNYYGDLKIAVSGEVEGKSEDGIRALNYADGYNVTVTTGVGSKVTGSEYGIHTRQDGTGDLTLTIYGEVTGTNSDGLEAVNSDGKKLTITTGAQSIITGGFHGIYVDNHGYGDAEIRARGIVTGFDGDGIHASNSSTSGNQKGLKVITTAGSVVTGGYHGIYGSNFGDLDLEITADGLVTGEGSAGIYGENAGDGDLFIRVGANGIVEGNETGIYAKSGFLDQGQSIFITNSGIVRNLSGETDDRAIMAVRGPARINNNASLIGTVGTGTYADTVNNAGLWDFSGGTSDFGDEADMLNNSGVLRAANDKADTGEVTVIDNLESFNNKGRVTLADGDVGDELQLNGPVTYTGQGGRLAVDVLLAPGGTADVLRIDGQTSGVTYVAINVTNPLSITPNTDGIAVAVVSGATANGDFDAEDGVINAGFFAWDVRLDEDGHTHELYTAGLGAGAYEFAAGITGAQDLWHQTNGTILQRQADLRVLLEGMSVTPVADYSEPVAATPVAKVTPGFWFRGVGAYSERDDEQNGIILDRKQATYGGLAGIDFGTQDVGDALMFGVFGGYIASDLDFDRTNTEWEFEGPTIGVYATYLDHAFYADATVKVDFLDIDIDADDLAPGAGEADTDAFNIGGQIDLGYKVGLDHGLFVDPQASLAVVHTEIDDIDDILGGAVEFDDATSVRGRVGLRLGHETTTGDGTIYSGDVTASVWQEFAGDNEATIFAPLTPATNVSDDPAETYGDVSVGFNVLAPDGWSGFLKANYLFGEDYEAVSGNAGLRYAF